MRVSLDLLDHGQRGWLVDGVNILPVGAFHRAEFWYSHVLASLPTKAKKIREYSESRGWSEEHAEYNWTPVLIKWLNKNAERL